MIYPAAFRIIRFVCPLLLLCVSHSLFVCWISMLKQEWGKWEAVVKGEGSLGCRICCLSVKIPLCNCEKILECFDNATSASITYIYVSYLSISLSLSHSLTTRSTTQGVTCYSCCCCHYVTASGTCMQRCSDRRCSCCCCSCAYVLLNNCK